MESLLAITAFLPATVCTGYVAAWFTNLHGFRQRSLIERIFWSVPLSLAVTTISSVLVGKFLSLNAVVVLLLACTLLFTAVLCREWLELRRARKVLQIGVRPFGGIALILVVLWIAVVVASLVDMQSNQKLFMNLAVLDQSYRVNWTESILRTGIPPTNSLYFYKHSVTMRNYYFWYVLCAVIARMTQLPVRCVMVASSVWSGFALAALNGLYLKHFLEAGIRLRQQFLRACGLLMVTGLDICVMIWDVFHHQPLPPNMEAWSKDPILSWFDSLLWTPHHVAGLVCCMFGFLLAWMAGKENARGRALSAVLIAAAFASAFGLSIYVAFAFFLVMLAWALWQVVIERAPRPTILMAAGGVGAAFLLIPYLLELHQTSSGMHGKSIFAFAIREIFAPDRVLGTNLFHGLSISHPIAALNLVRLLLLAPGFAVEFGFYLAVSIIYLFPALRGRSPLTPAQRSLLFISLATLPFLSLMRSNVITLDDFGMRAPLLMQFALLLLASELILSWRRANSKQDAATVQTSLPHNTPAWLRASASFALILGACSTIYQALSFRFLIPVAEASLAAGHNPTAGNLSHNVYIRTIGFAHMDAAIPQDAVVQYNPAPPYPLWLAVDASGVNRQTAIAFDQPSCGSEFGGNPGGCPAMAAAVDTLYRGATAVQARATCHSYGIQYLVAGMYDPAWKDKSSWVWSLKPSVSDDEFRVLDCDP